MKQIKARWNSNSNFRVKCERYGVLFALNWEQQSETL